MRRAPLRGFVVAGLAIALLLAVALGPLASSSPDGLERVAADEHFDDTAREHAMADGPLADYGFAGLNGPWSQAVPAIVGIGVTFVIGAGLLAAARRLTPGPDRDRSGPS